VSSVVCTMQVAGALVVAAILTPALGALVPGDVVPNDLCLSTVDQSGRWCYESDGQPVVLQALRQEDGFHRAIFREASIKVGPAVQARQPPGLRKLARSGGQMAVHIANGRASRRPSWRWHRLGSPTCSRRGARTLQMRLQI